MIWRIKHLLHLYPYSEETCTYQGESKRICTQPEFAHIWTKRVPCQSFTSLSNRYLSWHLFDQLSWIPSHSFQTSTNKALLMFYLSDFQINNKKSTISTVILTTLEQVMTPQNLCATSLGTCMTWNYIIISIKPWCLKGAALFHVDKKDVLHQSKSGELIPPRSKSWPGSPYHFNCDIAPTLQMAI